MVLEKRFVDKQAYNFLSSIPKINELDFVNDVAYRVSTEQEVLYPIIANCEVIIAAGSYFGDEGKGKTTDAVAKHPEVEVVMRANSGENAGHTVVANGIKFVFHLTPSGILVPGKKCLIGSECVMDPVSFMENEIRKLKDNQVDCSNLYVGNVHIVTPYHKLIDLAGNPTNSSTLKGMSPSHATKVTKRGLRLNHLFNDENEQRKRLQKDLHYYHGMLHTMKITEKELLNICHQMNSGLGQKVPEHIVKFLEAEDKIDFLIHLYQEIVVNNSDFPQRADTIRMVTSALERGKKVLIEGPQSFYLSNAIETHWSSATSADTTAAGIMSAAKYNCFKYRTKVINVHKTPASSRVGLGSNPAAYVPQDFFSSQGVDSLHPLDGACEDFAAIQRQFFSSFQENGVFRPTVYVDKDGQDYDINVAMAIASSKHHGEKGATTGKPRILGLFDCVAHHKVNLTQGPYLSLSAVDRGDDYDKVGLTIAYVVYVPGGRELHSNGRTYKTGEIIKAGDPLPCEQVLKFCHPINKIIAGWKGTPIAAGKRGVDNPLPQSVQDFLGAVEHYTGAEIISIGNGPRAEDLIYVKRV